jgi:hypothetical protein
LAQAELRKSAGLFEPERQPTSLAEPSFSGMPSGSRWTAELSELETGLRDHAEVCLRACANVRHVA